MTHNDQLHVEELKMVQEGNDAATKKALKDGVKKPKLKKAKRTLPQAQDRIGATFLDAVAEFKAYLQKIDPRNPDVDAYEEIVLAAGLRGDVFLPDKNGVLVRHSKFSSVRRLIKGAVYRQARLKPRLSDEDFRGQAGCDAFPQMQQHGCDTATENSHKEVWQLSLEECDALLEEYIKHIEVATKHVKANSPLLDVKTQMSFMMTVNIVSMDILQHCMYQRISDSPDDEMELLEIIMRKTCSTIRDAIPDEAVRGYGRYLEMLSLNKDLPSLYLQRAPAVGLPAQRAPGLFPARSIPL